MFVKITQTRELTLQCVVLRGKGKCKQQKPTCSYLDPIALPYPWPSAFAMNHTSYFIFEKLILDFRVRPESWREFRILVNTNIYFMKCLSQH